PLPACLAGEAVRQLERRAALLPRPLPACLAGEAVRWLLTLSELRNSFTCRASRQGSASEDGALLAAELVHLPGEPAGVRTIPIKKRTGFVLGRRRSRFWIEHPGRPGCLPNRAGDRVEGRVGVATKRGDGANADDDDQGQHHGILDR